MTGVERAAEPQEGLGTNKPRGEEDTEQKGGETGHWNKAASLVTRERDLGGLLQKVPGAFLTPATPEFGKKQHCIGRQACASEIHCFMKQDSLTGSKALYFLQLTSNL